jgi:ribosomal protein L3 glutamine methyltransferase
VTLIQMVELSAARLQEAGVCFGHGTENAFDEAVWLVLWRLGLPLDELDSVAAQALDADQQAAVQMLVDQRIGTRQPAAYLTHEAWLQGVPFYVDSRAVVPRSLIAELIDDGTLDAWLGTHTRHVLDLCTGNGSLAVLAALAWPEVRIDASDLSAAALAVARINIERHELDDRITLHEADGLQGLPRRYDLILCNPPYVNSASMAELPAEYQHEPALALAGGADGMDLVRSILRDAPACMNEHAVLVLEIGNERMHFERAFARLDTVWLETSAGDDQVLLLTREALAPHAPR